MKTRFYGGPIYADGQIKTDFEVVIEGDAIVYAGIRGGFGDTTENEIDLAGHLLMPGFVNCHAHAGLTLARGLAEGKKLQAWLTEDIFPFEEKLTEEDVYWGTLLAHAEFAKNGITSVADMYFFPEAIAAAHAASGLTGVLIGAQSDLTQDADIVLAAAEAAYKRYGEDPAAAFGYRLGFHAPYTASEAYLKGMAALVQRFSAPCYTHLQETRREVEEWGQLHGCTPLCSLLEAGIFAYGGAGFHCVHMTPEEIAAMAESKIGAVINSGSNLKLASGIAPVAEFERAGVLLGLGTDSAASNNALSMFREMYLTASLQKIKYEDASCFDHLKTIGYATACGAQVLGIRTGRICAGYTADLIVIDTDSVCLQPEGRVLSALVWSGNASLIEMTMARGKIVYQKGSYFLGESVDYIRSKCNNIVKRIGLGK